MLSLPKYEDAFPPRLSLTEPANSKPAKLSTRGNAYDRRTGPAAQRSLRARSRALRIGFRR